MMLDQERQPKSEAATLRFALHLQTGTPRLVIRTLPEMMPGEPHLAQTSFSNASPILNSAHDTEGCLRGHEEH
eukprot:g73528.t1